jgi:hypothetical protein
MADAGSMSAGGTSRMLTVAVAAEMIYQLVGSNMSSPQTAELNAAARAPTISKWVNLTNAEAAFWIIFLCVLDRSWWPALGGLLAGVGMFAKYKYAIASGLKSAAPPTENYGPAPGTSGGPAAPGWSFTTG